jgi:hypothetical protein
MTCAKAGLRAIGALKLKAAAMLKPQQAARIERGMSVAFPCAGAVAASIKRQNDD